MLGSLRRFPPLLFTFRNPQHLLLTAANSPKDRGVPLSPAAWCSGPRAPPADRLPSPPWSHPGQWLCGMLGAKKMTVPGGEAETGKRRFFGAGYSSKEVSGRDRREPSYKPLILRILNGAQSSHWSPGSEPRASLTPERSPGCRGLEGNGRATESQWVVTTLMSYGLA